VVDAAAADAAFGRPADGRRVGRRAAANAIFSGIAQILGKATTLAWTAVAARELLKESFGAFNLALAVATIAITAAEWGFDATLAQRISRDPQRGSALLTGALMWECLIALPLFGAGAVVVWRLDEEQILAVSFVFVAVFLDGISDTCRSAAAGVQRQGGVSTALVLQRVLTAALVIPLLVAGGGLTGLTLGFLASSVLGLVAHLVALRRLGIVVTTAVRWPVMRLLSIGTSRIGVGGLILAALFRVDAVMLTAFKGEEALASYSTAYKTFETALFMSFAVNGATFPVMCALAHDPRRFIATVERSISMVNLAYLPFAAICLVDAPRIIGLLYGPGYESATPALRWLALGPVVYAAAFLGGSALVAAQRTTGVLVAAAAAAVINVSLNFALIPLLGGTGAAAMTTISYTVEAAVTFIYIKRAVGVRPALIAPSAEAGISAVMLAAILWLAPLPAFINIAVGSIVYVLVWLALVQWRRPDELVLIRETLRSSGSRD
jgi:O-antigen/teichoic acid export membrane protein